MHGYSDYSGCWERTVFLCFSTFPYVLIYIRIKGEVDNVNMYNPSSTFNDLSVLLFMLHVWLKVRFAR